MSHEERKELGLKGRQHVLDNYGFEQYQKGWEKIIDDAIEIWLLGYKKALQTLDNKRDLI